MKALHFVQDVRNYSPSDTASWPASLQFSVTPLEEVQLKNSTNYSPAAKPGTYLTKYLYRPSTRSPLYLITTSKRSGRSCFPANETSLLMGLITCVTSLDAFSTLHKRDLRNGLFKLDKPKPGRLTSGLYTGWDSTSHLHIRRKSDTKVVIFGFRLSHKIQALIMSNSVTLLWTSGHIIFCRNTRYYSAVTVDFNINLQLLGSKSIRFMILSE